MYRYKLTASDCIVFSKALYKTENEARSKGKYKVARLLQRGFKVNKTVEVLEK